LIVDGKMPVYLTNSVARRGDHSLFDDDPRASYIAIRYRRGWQTERDDVTSTNPPRA
jgi:hypothetical protein